MSRHRVFLLIALPVVAVIGCGNVSFDVSQDIPVVTIPGDPTSMPLAVDTPPEPLELDIDAATSAQHTGPASAAYLKALSFTITQPPQGTFYFVTEVHIYIVPANPASKLPSVKIADLKPVPNENTVRFVPVPGVNILPYSKEGANITAEAFGFYPKEDTSYVGHVVVQVKI